MTQSHPTSTRTAALRHQLEELIEGAVPRIVRRQSESPLMEPTEEQHRLEWLSTNALGSFAMGTVDRIARRKYHGLLTVREPGHGDPLNVVADVEEWIEIGDELYALHAHDWGHTVEPKGNMYLVGFDPTPKWVYSFGGLRLTRELHLDDHADAVRLMYTVEGVRSPIRLRLRPLLRVRSFHQLTHANAFLNGQVHVERGKHLEASLLPYEGLPGVVMTLQGLRGEFSQDGHWYEHVHYEWESKRGYDAEEDLFTPGEFHARLDSDVTFELRIGTEPATRAPGPDRDRPLGRRASFREKLESAADSYLVELKDGRSAVIAGYPWFGEWSRDTLISLPGLCLMRGEVELGLKLLESLADRREGGLIPNLPRSGALSANTNSADASLLFIRAVELVGRRSRSRQVKRLKGICFDLVEQIGRGADPRVRVDKDGFLFVEPGPWALSWMDALVDGQPVTPRHGYAVDLNALWLSALRATLRWAKRDRPRFVKRWAAPATRLADGFEARFWMDDVGYLADTHNGKIRDGRLRPNQLWALALARAPIAKERQLRALEAIREHLVTPVGLRTLAPHDPEYRSAYAGDQASRDRAYHQGTVWPWLFGIYADAVLSIEGKAVLRAELAPIAQRLAQHFDEEGCVGQLGEVFDGEPPHQAGGAPAQAWSVAEVLRAIHLAGL